MSEPIRADTTAFYEKRESLRAAPRPAAAQESGADPFSKYSAVESTDVKSLVQRVGERLSGKGVSLKPSAPEPEQSAGATQTSKSAGASTVTPTMNPAGVTKRDATPTKVNDLEITIKPTRKSRADQVTIADDTTVDPLLDPADDPITPDDEATDSDTSGDNVIPADDTTNDGGSTDDGTITDGGTSDREITPDDGVPADDGGTLIDNGETPIDGGSGAIDDSSVVDESSHGPSDDVTADQTTDPGADPTVVQPDDSSDDESGSGVAIDDGRASGGGDPVVNGDDSRPGDGPTIDDPTPLTQDDPIRTADESGKGTEPGGVTDPGESDPNTRLIDPSGGDNTTPIDNGDPTEEPGGLGGLIDLVA